MKRLECSMEGVFDIALPKKVLSNSLEKPNTDLLNRELRILYCRKDQNRDIDLVMANSSVGPIHCKDLTEDWLLGYFNGKYYGALFVLAKKGILKDNSKELQEVNMQSLSEGDEEKFNDELVKTLKLASKPSWSFKTDIHFVNFQDGYLLTEKPKLDWCGEKMCFLWGNIIDKSDGLNDKSNNCDSDNSLKGCEIKIINPSSGATLKPFSSFWNLDKSPSSL